MFVPKPNHAVGASKVQGTTPFTYGHIQLFRQKAQTLTNQARFREARYIPRSSNSTDFETMCQHVYGEQFHSTGVRLYGRPGQYQSGLDILFHDFRKAPVSKGQGMVLVQCKYTTQDELKISKVEADVLSALSLIRSDKGYEGVYLFIVATNALNDTKLHDALQELMDTHHLPFNIELHSWDKLCQTIIQSDRLWELFNDNPSTRLEPEYKLKEYVLTASINSCLEKGLLEDAHSRNRQRKDPQYTPGYGSSNSYLPDDVCRRSARLRKALLSLFAAAADAHGALEFLEYEFNLDGMLGGESCLDYLHAQRIVGNLRSPERPYLFVGEGPRFAQLLTELESKICDVQASPDCLSALALLLVMESEDQGTQDAGLNMMRDRVERDRGSKWEMDSLIAHAVVRYYYVLRRGWTPIARYYALGDSVGNISRSGLPASPWGASFDHDETLQVLIAGQNPFDIPRYSGVSAHFLLPRLEQYLNRPFDPDKWPRLSAQCRVYSAADHDPSEGNWKFETSKILSHTRVIDFEGLATSAANGDPKELLQKYTLVTTQRTFERLLGYRAFLRAYIERTVEHAGKYAAQLAAVEYLIQCSDVAPSKIEMRPGRLWISTVYDNPPPRLDSYTVASADIRSPFTLPKVWLETRLGFIQKWPLGDEKWRSLNRQYEQRDDDFSLACLLALHHHLPLLTYSGLARHNASNMGIAAEHPDRVENTRLHAAWGIPSRRF